MSVFSSVLSTQPIGQIGQLAYGEDANKLVRSYVLISATPVPVGRGVVYDSSNDTAMLPSGASQLFLGVAFDDKSLAIESPSYVRAADGGWPNMPVLKRGLVWVPISQDVDPSLPVYLQHTSGGGALLPGVFRADADTANASLVAATVAQWEGPYTAVSGRALLSINLPL